MTRLKARPAVGRRAAIAGAGALLAFPAIRAQAQASGVALVIGNSKYQWEAQLPNVRRDAPDIAARFQALGLQTELIQDAGGDAMRQAIDKFKSTSRGANLAAFYYAGHGADWNKEPYLVPADADLTAPSAVKTLIPASAVRLAMGEAANRLLVFDNCRNNPADGWRQLEAERSAGGSLAGNRAAAAGAVPNTLWLYSTAPGRVALDGPAGGNSPFAAVFLRQLAGQSVDFLTLPANLRRELLIATQGRQVLWDINRYRQPFLLGGSGSRQSAAPSGNAARVSGGSHDPSRIIELNNAYAYAQQNQVPLPPGLIAYRPNANSPDGSKVGAFKFIGPNQSGHRVPQMIVVMSVDGQQIAQVIYASGEGGGYNFITGALSGNRLELVRRDRGARFLFDWSDANSGSFSALPETNKPPYSASFSRLDG